MTRATQKDPVGKTSRYVSGGGARRGSAPHLDPPDERDEPTPESTSDDAPD